MNDNNYKTILDKRDLNTSSYKMNMNKKDLKRLSKSQLIKLLIKQEKSGQANEFENSVVLQPKQEESLPGKNINSYEDLIIEPPEQFRDKQRPPPPPMKEHITDVPSPKIQDLNQALKSHTKSYGIELQDNLNPLNHFTKTKALVESHLEIRNPIY